MNYEKSCYRSVSDPLLSWKKARDVCRKGNNTSTHGDLVTVNNRLVFIFNQSYKKFSNMIGYHQSDLSTNKKMFASCL